MNKLIYATLAKQKSLEPDARRSNQNSSSLNPAIGQLYLIHNSSEAKRHFEDGCAFVPTLPQMAHAITANPAFATKRENTPDHSPKSSVVALDGVSTSKTHHPCTELTYSDGLSVWCFIVGYANVI